MPSRRQSSPRTASPRAARPPRAAPVLTLAPPQPTEKQQRSSVYRHPQRDDIEALFAVRTPEWIAAWLRQIYPTEQPGGARHENAAQHERLRISARALKKYRDLYFPEHRPGVEATSAALEDLIGRRPPAGARHELDRLDTLQGVADYNLTQAMKVDQALGMLTPSTLAAQQFALDATLKAIDAKSKLGLPGYEAAAVNINATTTNRNLNVDVSGRVDPRTGEQVPDDPDRVDTMRQVLAMGPDAVLDAVRAAKAQSDVVDGVAVEDTDAA